MERGYRTRLAEPCKHCYRSSQDMINREQLEFWSRDDESSGSEKGGQSRNCGKMLKLFPWWKSARIGVTIKIGFVMSFCFELAIYMITWVAAELLDVFSIDSELVAMVVMKLKKGGWELDASIEEAALIDSIQEVGFSSNLNRSF